MKTFELILNNGKKMQISGAGEADGFLWIYGLSGSMFELVSLFDDMESTKKIVVDYKGSLPEAVFEGYTHLTIISRDRDETCKVCLEKV